MLLPTHSLVINSQLTTQPGWIVAHNLQITRVAARNSKIVTSANINR